MLFEIYKIIVDVIKSKSKHHGNLFIGNKATIPVGSIIPVVILIILLLIDFNQLFKINFVLLMLFMFARSIKEIIKERKK
ncbi:hypothetical protein SD457_04190 [Coprobacillaceae bacterium CR2/5/TPMF4]|nr:hypothetical protein SD457_04190 [Coprobacillaceae bacterium CR2/5/TPMF4]